MKMCKMNKCYVSFICLTALLGVVMPNPEDDGEVLIDPLEERTFEMPATCKSENKEFCFDDTGYPVDIIEELLKEMPNLEVAKDEDVGHLENRQGDEPDCRAQATTAPIHYIKDEFGKDRVVVQMKDKFEQRYSVMWCDKAGRITSRTEHFLEKTVNDYKMTCENKYMHYDFLVLSLKPDMSGKWKLERTRTKTGIPVCCACKYERRY